MPGIVFTCLTDQMQIINPGLPDGSPINSEIMNQTVKSLKEIVKGNQANFSHYRAGHLYYNVTVEGEQFSFPVPIEDVGDATFLKQEKAIIMMRYIRKALEAGAFVKAN